MKILVINGSPKKEKSDTMHITRAFFDGMNEVSENEIHIIHATDKHIAYCTGALPVCTTAATVSTMTICAPSWKRYSTATC